MTAHQLTEALRAVAEETSAPEQDAVHFQRLVRVERRRRRAGRAGIAVAAAAAVAAVVASVVPFVHDGGDASPAGGIELQAPVFVTVDGRLHAVDPHGEVHDLGVPAQEVLGATDEHAYVVTDDSGIERYDAHPGERWTFERAGAGVDGPVQSAQVSADGRFLGWIDLRERLHVRDLRAGTTADPVRGRGSAYLADLGSRTGEALVVDRRGLVLHRRDGAEVVLAGDSWDATVSGDQVAVPNGERTSTVVYRVGENGIDAVLDAPGHGRLSPLGDLVVSVSDDEGDAGSTAWLTAPGQEPRSLAVPGRPEAAAWADGDTALVTTWLDGESALYGCEVSDSTGACAPLGVTGERIDLGR